MTGRGVLVYGSLLHEPTLAATFSEGTVADAVPVEVDGYRRRFDKASAYREGDGGETAILNAAPDPESWLNAVLVPDVPEGEFEEYERREFRYELVDVPANDVTPYFEADEPVVEPLDERLIATSDGGLDDPEPIPYYADQCVEGARGWGEKFLADFLVTTDRV
ncbi:hypothetical protein [Halorientalis halophila]|uniref:hypothetical protein n=1 Tax=Halorientalis halophila TaxID=3108499 RepID=UPI00300BC567